MGTFHRLLSLLVVTVVLLSSCGQEENVTSQLGGDKVVVHLNAGDMAAVSSSSRAAFTENNPVTVLVYQRNKDNLASAQYDVLYGSARGEVLGTNNGANLSPVALSEFEGNVNINDDGNLTVEGGHTYDFVIIVNLPESATISKGVISGITNGADIMVGRATNQVVAAGATSTTVTFNDLYEDKATGLDSNLPHLTSKITVKASVDETIINSTTNGKVKIGVLSAEFYNVNDNASFDFTSQYLKKDLTLSGDVVSSFKLTNNDIITSKGNIIQDNLTTISSTDDKATYDKGNLLPIPLRSDATNSKNKMDIDFTVAIVNGKLRSNTNKQAVVKSLYSAKGVEVPELKTGYEYTFELVMKGKDKNDPIALYLNVKPWNQIGWSSEMGNEGNLLRLTVDSWNTTSWSTLMGGESDTYIWTPISNWDWREWDASMGE